MKVVDNFLPIGQFNKIQSTLLSNFFPWYWYDDSTYEGDGDDQLVHSFITEGKIHSDFEKGFIRAETVSYNDFVENSGWLKSKESGKMRLEGKDYVVKDGDILNFRFNT